MYYGRSNDPGSVVKSRRYDIVQIWRLQYPFPSAVDTQRYVEVKEWDNGYIVVMADYEGMGITEEYIDLVPILENLYIDPATFLKDIKTVKIGDYET